MTLEELEIRFLADVAPLEAGLSAVSDAMSACQQKVQGLQDAFYSAGAQASEGLANGVLSRQAQVEGAARRIAQAAAAAMRAALAIHSPSRVTMDMGRRLDEGLSRGMESGAPGVARAAQAVSAVGLGAFSALEPNSALPPSAPSDAGGGASALSADALREAISALSIRIPIELDGYQLGLAAIEGINRVCSGTGRVELTL